MELVEKLEKLIEIKEVQCQDGNWDVSPYMTGLANGLILAVAIMKDKDPDYKDIKKDEKK